MRPQTDIRDRTQVDNKLANTNKQKLKTETLIERERKKESREQPDTDKLLTYLRLLTHLCWPWRRGMDKGKGTWTENGNKLMRQVGPFVVVIVCTLQQSFHIMSLVVKVARSILFLPALLLFHSAPRSPSRILQCPRSQSKLPQCKTHINYARGSKVTECQMQQTQKLKLKLQRMKTELEHKKQE